MDTTRASLLMRIKDPANATAWRDFDAIYRPMLHRFATLRGLDDSTAEDVVQHCMASVHQHIRSFEYDPSRGRFKSWLRTMVNNRIRNLHRDRHEDEAKTQDFRRSQDREPSPEEAFDKLWMEEHLRHAMEELHKEVGDSTYAAFTAYAIDGKPVEDVCKQYEMTANQLYKIKWRLTQRLSEMLKNLIGEDA